MAQNLSAVADRLRAGRVRILWLVLGAMLLVSALPLLLYHRQVLKLSQDKLARYRARAADRADSFAGAGTSAVSTPTSPSN